MQLQTHIQKTNATLADQAADILAHLHAAADRANGMGRTILQLSGEDLQTWLNERPITDTMELFGSHEALGHAINGAMQIAATVIDGTVRLVDVRPFGEKLASVGQEVAVNELGQFVVSRIYVAPPEPSTEPEWTPPDMPPLPEPPPLPEG